MSDQTLTFSRTVKASPEQVYQAFTNGTTLREWLCDVATVAPNPGGRIYLWWNSGYYTSGEYMTSEPSSKVAFSWNGRREPSETKVEVNITSQEGSTLITLKHSGIGSGDAWNSPVTEIKKGWESGLENLASILENGADLRFVRRPMLGILVGDFDEEHSKQLQVPVKKGIRIDNPIEGMGAAAAGLQQNDVIIKMAGHEITDWTSLTNALSSNHAGDKIEVVFYRGPEKKTVTMELSQRPLPEIPATVHALAEEIRKKYANLEATLDQVLSGVSEEQTSHKPAPDEWSIKEIIAHLIHSERGWQQWISELATSQEPVYDDFGGNLDARVQATVAAYPNNSEILGEFTRSRAETVALVAALPDQFMARKGSYWRVAYNLLETDFHFNTHLEQIQTALTPLGVGK